MPDPANNDAALVRAGLLNTSNALVPGTMTEDAANALAALDRLAERTDEAERAYETAERAAVMWMERAERAEATNTRLREALEAIADSGDSVVNLDGKEIQPYWRRDRLYGSPRLYARADLAQDAEQENA